MDWYTGHEITFNSILLILLLPLGPSTYQSLNLIKFDLQKTTSSIDFLFFNKKRHVIFSGSQSCWPVAIHRHSFDTLCYIILHSSFSNHMKYVCFYTGYDPLH